ncbi:MAG: 23S rRNA pseudouridine1911/1915/1917 synthase [Hyphomicrobiaceae bacterium]|jgi:23S rRNA pseudouridine1911/1915/1917 synthase
MVCDSANAVRRLVVDEADVGNRLDRYLSGMIADISRQRLKALILDGQVSVDGTPKRDPAYKVRAGIAIEVLVPEPAPAAPLGEDISLNVAYEDAHLIVIDKPPGLVAHPAPGNETGTLVNALIAHCGDELSGIGGVKRPGIVHRLDKDTSGLLVVAKTDQAHQGLSAQFQAHGSDGLLQREYLALVWGRFERPKGAVDAPIERSRFNRRKMAVAKAGFGRHAITHYAAEAGFTTESGAEVSRLRLQLETGRTHQIRVHLAAVGHPLLGDSIYGSGFKASEALLPSAAQDALQRLERQALHATVLGFQHPANETAMRFESQMPDDMRAVMDSLTTAR